MSDYLADAQRKQMLRINALQRKFLLTLASLGIAASACQIGAIVTNVISPTDWLLALGVLASTIITITTLMAYRSLGKWLERWSNE